MPTYTVTVKYRVNAEDVKQAMRRIARFNSDIVYCRTQEVTRDPEVRELDTTIVENV